MDSLNLTKKYKNNDPDIELPQSTRRSFKMLGLTSFPSFKILLPYESLTFKGNPIDSFLTLPSLPNLKRLDVSDTDLNSYQYIQSQPIIESVYIKNTPLFHYNEVILMTVIAFGHTLKTINGSIIPQSIYRRGLEMKPYLFCYLYNGWIILGDDPIKIFNVNTRKRLFFVSLKSIPQIPMKKCKDETDILSKSYSNLSFSNHKQKKNNSNLNNSNSQNENNNINIIKKKVSNISKDRISQSMPRIPKFHTLKNSTLKRAEKITNRKLNNNNNQPCCKTPQQSHKRNISQDFNASNTTNIKPIIRGSKSHFSKNLNSNYNITNNESDSDRITNKKASPVLVRKKRHSYMPNVSSKKIIKNEKLLFNDDSLSDSHEKINGENNEIKEDESVLQAENHKSVSLIQNSKELNEINQTKHIIGNDNNKNSSQSNQHQYSNLITDNLKPRLASKKTDKSFLNCNSEKIDENQIQNIASESLPEISDDNQCSDDKSNKDSLQLLDSSSSFEDMQNAENNNKSVKLLTKRLDHSNALCHLSSIKCVYQDLLFSLPTSDISETNEYISDAQIDKQLEIINSTLQSDSTINDDFSSSISYI